MYGDFSRDSFDAAKSYSRVLIQQGRPLTDADWNEQASIAEQRYREVLRWILKGKDSGTINGGFKPSTVGENQPMVLTEGVYIVDGLVCRNPGVARLHPDASTRLKKALEGLGKKGGPVYLCLEAWEQSVNPIMEKDLLEPALQGADTCWRSRIAWRLALRRPVANTSSPSVESSDDWSILGQSDPLCRQIFVRRRDRTVRSDGPCATPEHPTSSSVERLYRIEIHRSGKPHPLPSGEKGSHAPIPDGERKPDDLMKGGMTFKWSRDNGSTICAVEPPSGSTVVQSDHRFSSREPITRGVYLELRDQFGRSSEKTRNLAKVQSTPHGSIQLARGFLLPKPEDGASSHYLLESADVDPGSSKELQYHVQAWHQSGHESADEAEKSRESVINRAATGQPTLCDDGSIIGVSCSGDRPVWLDLEDGIQVRFCPNTRYEEGDYWLVRTSAFSESGFVGVPEAFEPEKGREKDPPLYRLALAGRRHLAVLAEYDVTLDSATDTLRLSEPRTNKYWNPTSEWSPTLLSRLQATLRDYWKQLGNGPSDDPLVPDSDLGDMNPAGATPAEGAEAGGEPAISAPAPPAGDNSPSEPQGAILSPEGNVALARYLTPSRDVTRHVPARYLNHEPKSPSYRRFRAALLVSDILEPTLAQFLAKVERCLPLTDDNRLAVIQDAEHDYRLATDFRRLASAGEGRSSIV